MFRYSFRIQRNFSFSLPSPRKLDQVTSVSKLQQETPETVTHIWTTYHADKKDAHALVINGTDHSTLMSRAKTCPLFIYPVFKDGGFMWMLSQFQQNFFIATYLEEYKRWDVLEVTITLITLCRDPSTASPWLSLYLYPDLIPTKDLALIRSDFLPNLDKQSAQLLSKMIIQSYTDPTDEYYRFIRLFNKDPNSFDVNSCLETYKRIKLYDDEGELAETESKN